MVRSSIFAAAICTLVVAVAAEPPKDHPKPPSYPPPPPAYGPPKPPKGPPKKPLDKKKLINSIKKEKLSEKAKQLQAAAYSSPDRNRVFGSPGHENTLDLISGYLDKHSDYFTYVRQPFEALFSQASGRLSANGVDQGAVTYSYTPSTPNKGEIVAPIIAVPNNGCVAADFPSTVRGNIALIQRGVCEFGLKSALAGNAGAAAAVIYDNIDGPLLGATLGPPPRPQGPYVPTVGITKGNGTNIANALAAGQTVQGVIQVDSVIENRTTYNILADTIGGDPNNILSVGGHSDSVFAGPGINDDGSGIIGILEVAEQLAKGKYDLKNRVRFSFWSAEEFGLLGSGYYIANLPAEEREKIRLYLNFDMIASPNYILGIYDGDGSKFGITGPPGSAQAEKFFEDFFKSQGVNSVPTNFSGRSDYGPFLEVGIAAGGLFTGAEELKTVEEARLFGGEAGKPLDANYHKIGDTYDNLNFDAFVVNTKAIAASVAEYATSFDSLPPRNATQNLLNRNFEPKQKVGLTHTCHSHDVEEAVM